MAQSTWFGAKLASKTILVIVQLARHLPKTASKIQVIFDDVWGLFVGFTARFSLDRVHALLSIVVKRPIVHLFQISVECFPLPRFFFKSSAPLE